LFWEIQLTLESALLKQILANGDFNTWNGLKEHYFPEGEYRKLWKIVDKHVHKYHDLPTFEDLKLEIRSRELQEKIYAIETVETDVDAILLLDYLKNQFTQSEILTRIESFVDNQIAIGDARENIDLLQEIVVQVEDRVETTSDNESMDTIELFDSEEDYAKYLPLGLNSEYDFDYKFSPKDLVVVGGSRGGGKSFTCCNVAQSATEKGKSALYFTIEMEPRQILQRICAMACNVPIKRINTKNLSPMEWSKIADWWAGRFEKGEEAREEYNDHQDFDKFHYQLTRNPLRTDVPQVDIYYDPSLTLAKIISVVRQKVASTPDLGVVIVDYLNQVRRHNAPSRGGQYEWTEQIEISKGLKSLAQENNVLVLSAFQTNEKGEARFAKGILDAVDAAYSIQHWGDQEPAIKLKCDKMRNGKVEGFVSTMNWDSLRIGPQNEIDPDERAEMKEAMSTGESSYDL
jgi:replicative DNA helicase